MKAAIWNGKHKTAFVIRIVEADTRPELEKITQSWLKEYCLTGRPGKHYIARLCGDSQQVGDNEVR